METPKDDSVRTVTGTFNVTMQLSQNRQLAMTGYVYSDDTKAELNARIDQYQDAIDRQFIRGDIVNMRAQREALVAQIQQIHDQLADLADKQKNSIKLSSQQREQVKRGDEAVSGTKKGIEQVEARIKAAEVKLAALDA